MAVPVDVSIKGQALNSRGLTAENAISGIGLLTFGFLWPCADIWTNSEESITTVWTDYPQASTVEDCID